MSTPAKKNSRQAREASESESQSAKKNYAYKLLSLPVVRIGGLQHIHIVVTPFLVHYRIDQHLCVQTLFSHFAILNSHARQQYFGTGFRGLLDLGSEKNILNVKSPQINKICNAVN